MSTNHTDAPLADFAAANDSPTTFDVRKLAFDLQKVYMQKKGLAPIPRPLTILFDGNITMDDLKARLDKAGIELFPGVKGEINARTVEVGNLHRELVKCEREVARLEREAHEEFVSDARAAFKRSQRAPITIESHRFQPSEPERVRDRDDDENEPA